jgi:hypothetical protein
LHMQLLLLLSSLCSYSSSSSFLLPACRKSKHAHVPLVSASGGQ